MREAALIALMVVGVAWVVFCLLTSFAPQGVRYLPRWVWAIICVISVPLGGIIYLASGGGGEDARPDQGLRRHASR